MIANVLECLEKSIRNLQLKVRADLIRHIKTHLENLMTSNEQEQFILRIRNYITSIAKTLNLTASFAPGRRKSDLLLVKLRGKHAYACAMASNLAEPFPEIDIEIPKIFQLDGCFTLIITQKLAEQEIIVKERRAKLIKSLGRKSVTSDQLVTPEDLYDTLFPENI